MDPLVLLYNGGACFLECFAVFLIVSMGLEDEGASEIVDDNRCEGEGKDVAEGAVGAALDVVCS